MTQAELDALRALADAATPGPWEVQYTLFDDEDFAPDLDIDAHVHTTARVDACDDGYICGTGAEPSCHADAAFIAAARAAVPALLAEVERLTRRNNELTEQLRFANEREAAVRVECGRLNGQAAGKVKELLAEAERLRAELALRDRYNEYVRVTQAQRLAEVLPFDEWNRGDVPPLRPDAPRLRRPTKD